MVEVEAVVEAVVERELEVERFSSTKKEEK